MAKRLRPDPSDASVTTDMSSKADRELFEQSVGTVEPHASVSRPLGALGITLMEERVYRILLVQSMGAPQVALELSISQELAEELLGSIEAKGLATHSPTTPRSYIAAPPEFTIKSLIRRRQAMAEQAHEVIPELKDLAERAAQRQGHDQVLELITNRANMLSVLSRIHRSVQSELLVFQRLPVLMPQFQEPIASGVRIRTITDGELLESPGFIDTLRGDMARGEDVRIYPTLPFKMMIVDRNVGLLRLASVPDELTLLVHRSAMLEALCMLFDLTWDRAMPLLPTQPGDTQDQQAKSRRKSTSDALISMLAAGLNDKVMVNELQVSAATLNRRISELMKAHGTRSRFQLGWRLALEAASSEATSNEPASNDPIA